MIVCIWVRLHMQMKALKYREAFVKHENVPTTPIRRVYGLFGSIIHLIRPRVLLAQLTLSYYLKTYLQIKGFLLGLSYATTSLHSKVLTKNQKRLKFEKIAFSATRS